jgi:hypothetical protein
MRCCRLNRRLRGRKGGAEALTGQLRQVLAVVAVTNAALEPRLSEGRVDLASEQRRLDAQLCAYGARLGESRQKLTRPND